MIVFVCDACGKTIKNEEFYGINFYKYTNKGDQISKTFHLCGSCYELLLKFLNQENGVKFRKIHYYDYEEHF